MNYYSVEFRIVKKGTFRFSSSGDDRGDGGFFAAQCQLEDNLCQAGVCTVHEYGWCDGSVYKFVRSNKDANDIAPEIDKVLTRIDSPFRVKKIRAVTDSSDPMSMQHWKSMQERFDNYDWLAAQPDEVRSLPTNKLWKLYEAEKERRCVEGR